MKNKINPNIYVAMFLFFSTHCSDNAYKTIEKILPLDMHGWFNIENANHLAQFIKTYNPKVIVEVGVWL